MKLLYFDLYLPFLLNQDEKIHGGTAMEWSNWLHGFNEIGTNIELLTWKGAKKYIKKKHSIKIRESYDPQKGLRILRVLYYRIPALYRAIKQSNATHIVHQNGSWIAGVLAMIAKIQNKQIVLRIASDPDVNLWVSKTNFYNKIGFSIGLYLSDIIICQNIKQRKTLSGKYPKKAIWKLYNPLNLKNIPKFDFKEKNDRNYITWIGRFSPLKNIPLLVDIVKALPHTNFKIVGLSLSSSKQIELEYLEKLKHLKNVELIHFMNRKAIFSLLQSSILLLSTSKREGFPNTFLEALFVGTPIVTTSSVNPDNIISDNNFGVVADGVGRLVQGIRYIQNNLNYELFYKKSHLFVKNNFDSVKQAKRFVSYLA